jgi:LEA14-like dessication related protein
MTLSFALSSCIQKPVFINIASVRVSSLKDSVLQTIINFRIYNPNGISSTITASKIKTRYKNKVVGYSELDRPMNLPAKDTIIIPMVSHINLWSLAGVFPELLATDSVAFRIEGDNEVRAFGIKWNVAVNENIKLNVKQAVIEQVNKTFQNDSNFKIKKIRLSMASGLRKTLLRMVAEVKNSFPFDYSLQRLNLDVYRKGGTTAIANWKLTDTIVQKANTIAEIPIAIAIDNFNMLSQAKLSDFLHPGIEVVLKGEAIISIQGRIFNIPVEETKSISFKPLSGFNIQE